MFDARSMNCTALTPPFSVLSTGLGRPLLPKAMRLLLYLTEVNSV